MGTKKTKVKKVFPEKAVAPKPIMQRVRSIATACKVLGDRDEEVMAYKALAKILPVTSHILAYQVLIVMIKALNEGWVPNWNNSNEWKFWNYFWVEANDKNPSGVGFSYSNYGHSGTNTDVGARLCMDASEKASHMIKIAKKWYKQYLLIPANKKVNHKIASL